jgi:hypothetical protein
MSFDKESIFARVIEDHLELKRRNAELDPNMPLDRYRVNDPFENHPLFKTEEQARLEDTLGGTEPAIDDAMVLAWRHDEPLRDEEEVADPEESLWGRSRDFDWGD